LKLASWVTAKWTVAPGLTLKLPGTKEKSVVAEMFT